MNEPTPALRAEMISQALSNGSAGAYGALSYITQPEVWPGFAAWAEQHTEGDLWDEQDRLDMINLAEMFAILARELDTR